MDVHKVANNCISGSYISIAGLVTSRSKEMNREVGAASRNSSAERPALKPWHDQGSLKYVWGDSFARSAQ